MEREHKSLELLKTINPFFVKHHTVRLNKLPTRAARKTAALFLTDTPIEAPKSRIEGNPKTHYNGTDRQAAWSICCTHNADSRQLPAALPRPVPLGQGWPLLPGTAGRLCDARRGRQYRQQCQNDIDWFIILCYIFKQQMIT